MSFKKKLKSFFLSPWFLALALLGIYLATNGYIYAWDDQHLEIPMLKSLIDNELYQGDYYVEALKQNFPSYFYQILAKLITVEQIPKVYFALFLLSRYFFFFWIYKLWNYIAKNRFYGFSCALVFILLGRVEEFLYRTFSHQEFALAIILAGFYYFYKERFVLASVIFGLAANIHAIYSAFPMAYLGFYLLLTARRRGVMPLLKSSCTFLLCASPVFILIFQKFQTGHLAADNPILANWMELYRLACPQNFIFQDTELSTLFNSWGIFIDAAHMFMVLLGLYLLNFTFDPNFRKDLKIQSIAMVTTVLLVVSFVFTYVYPSRFVLDLNLIRNIQYLLLMLIGYSTLLVLRKAESENIFIAGLLVLLFTFFRYLDETTLMSIGVTALVLTTTKLSATQDKTQKQKAILAGVGILTIAALISFSYFVYQNTASYSKNSKILLCAVCIILPVLSGVFLLFRKKQFFPALKSTLILVPLVGLLISYSYFHHKFVNVLHHGEGFWQLQRNWLDMQRYVKDNTPKNSLLLVPHNMEMGGFRILSERKIICSYRDCGVIGFDYKAAVEWKKRLEDIEAFEVMINKPIGVAIKNAILKYRVNYIVFMNYMPVPDNGGLLEETYSNGVFTLYKVKTVPVAPLKSIENQ